MPRTPQDRVKVNMFLQADVLAALKKMATIRGTTYSDLVRTACREYVVREGARLIEEQKQMAAMAPPLAFPVPVHWTKDPLVPYSGCSCQTCIDARATYMENAGDTSDDSDPRERG